MTPTPTPTPIPFRTYRHNDNAKSYCTKGHNFTIDVPRDWDIGSITCTSVYFDSRDEEARVSVRSLKRLNYNSDPSVAFGQIAKDYGDFPTITDNAGNVFNVEVISTNTITRHGRNVISQELEVAPWGTWSTLRYCKTYISRRIVLYATWSAYSETKRIFIADGTTCQRTDKLNALIMESLDSFRPIGSK